MRLWEKLMCGLGYAIPVVRGMGRVPAPPAAGGKRRRGSKTRPIAEVVESRLLLSAFYCNISAVPTRAHTSTFQMEITPTGGTPSKYVINWNDPGGIKSQTINSPGSAPYRATHPYTEAYTGPITVVATSTTNATATAYFALSSSFGNFQGVQGTGAAIYNPYGNTISVGQTFAAMDNVSGDVLNGDVFVAGAYSIGAGSYFGVTAFLNGQVDSRFGSINGVQNNGTFVVPQFGGGGDVPLAISVGSNGSNGVIAVAGKCATGFAVALISTVYDQPSKTYGVWLWNTPSYFEPGQANGVEVDSTDGNHLVAVGTDGTHIVAAAMNLDDGTPYNDGLGHTWGATGIITVPLSANAVSATGNTVVEEDEVPDTQNGENLIIIGGATNWQITACGCTPESGSDFTLVAVEDYTGTIDTDLRTNIGLELTAYGSCVFCSPSVDSVYSLVFWDDPVSGYVVDAIGQSTATQAITIAQYALNVQGVPTALVSGFGQAGSGIARGPAGNAYAAAIVSPTTGTFVVTGSTYAGGDMLTCQFNASGALDTTFGNAGVMQQDLGTTSANSYDFAYSVIVTTIGTDGYAIIIDGSTLQPGTTKYQIGMAEYLDSNQVVIS
ncbi:MAG TPA: hypothetical protein VFC78_24955 [Tepidisphaeraceae bacterium]|nr:hypothetical protein [Tepidisphaeraceae bacterium]